MLLCITTSIQILSAELTFLTDPATNLDSYEPTWTRAVVIKYRKYSRVILQPETEVYYRQGYGGNLLLPLLICDHWN
jgi:hypothetical protein